MKHRQHTHADVTNFQLNDITNFQLNDITRTSWHHPEGVNVNVWNSHSNAATSSQGQWRHSILKTITPLWQEQRSMFILLWCVTAPQSMQSIMQFYLPQSRNHNSAQPEVSILIEEIEQTANIKSIWIHLHRMSRKIKGKPFSSSVQWTHGFSAPYCEPFSAFNARVSAPYCAYLQTSCILVSKLHNKAQQLYVCWFDFFIYW